MVFLFGSFRLGRKRPGLVALAFYDAMRRNTPTKGDPAPGGSA
jgi:hypothetical protein